MNTASAMSGLDDSKDHDAAAPLAARFAALRGLMTLSTELVVPWRYFQEEMATELEFMSQGRWGDGTLLAPALREPMKRAGLIGQPGLTLTCHIEKYQFWHGIRIFDSKTGIFFLDEASRHGLLAVKKNIPHSAVELFSVTMDDT
ncbi:hypothetical protein LZC95_34775 [Pendulispora brunnea]|uniref:Uncharacterized protein n=1 Tax=Pendulispora brunnea TaxID=2905690 RepID=A0ABZ2K344_9BACT